MGRQAGLPELSPALHRDAEESDARRWTGDVNGYRGDEVLPCGLHRVSEGGGGGCEARNEMRVGGEARGECLEGEVLPFMMLERA